MRTESDSLGQREVPGAVYWGIHTLRATENFPVSGRTVHPSWIRALAEVKLACARAHTERGELPADVGHALQAAAAEVSGGALLDQFPVDALQGGAGTSLNMNMNEVLANRALEMLGHQRGEYAYVHPIDHANHGQSTNDTVPTALRIAAIRHVRELADELAALQEALQRKEQAFAGVEKLGRTELQDAVPMTLGQEFGAWAEAIARDRWRIYKAEERLRQVNLGGTAIGTGVGAERGYAAKAVEHLRRITGLGLARAENLIEATSNNDVLVEVSGLLKACAANLAKLAADLRLLASGPRGGLGEVRLPARQAGSSIMPGKVNPVMTEMTSQVAFEVMASDLAITLGAQAGQLQLNAFVPLMGDHLLRSMAKLTATCRLLRERCIDGVEADEEHCKEHLDRSTARVTSLVLKVGYDEATKLAKEKLAEDDPTKVQ
ncbi:MAG TPA: aspartate ammonia-lyase [Symbiobacteriaceae bacterium]|nr:aspartate ammonia-lyase [Symbiobacteriaceae bacterium]